MTLANQTRLRTLDLLERTLEETPPDELALLTNERHMLIGLSKALGQSFDVLLDTLYSSDVVQYRAAALVEHVQHEIAVEQAERKAKQRSRRPGRRH